MAIWKEMIKHAVTLTFVFLVTTNADQIKRRCEDSSVNCYFGRWTKYGACHWNNGTRAACPRTCGLCDVNCDRLANEERKDCGWYGIGREECIQRGCCWNPDSHGKIWCHYSKDEKQFSPRCKNTALGCYTLPQACVSRHGPTCERTCSMCSVNCENLPAINRHDCGWKGISEHQCLEKGCCWDDSQPGAIYCFYSKDDI